MKKKMLIITIIAAFTISLISCSYKNPPNDNNSNGSESTEIDKETSKDSSNNTTPKGTEPNTEGSSETNSENVNNYKADMLNNIKD